MGRSPRIKLATQCFVAIFLAPCCENGRWTTSAEAAEVAAAGRAAVHRPAEPIGGTLFLCGGGELPDRVDEEFHRLGGGAEGRLVVITTASADAGTPREAALVERWNRQGWKSAAVLHARSREAASAPEFSRPLREATAVWMVGGDQQRLLDAYSGTPVLKELHQVLARGGVIGGTSAGMAVAGERAIVGGREVPQLADGFGFVRGVIFDQHFSQRKREPRLEAAVAAHPGMVGIGVDEATALIVRGRELRVLGVGDVHVRLGKSQARDDRPLRLREFMRDDLVALSRAAIARAGEPFPAQVPEAPRVPHGALLLVGGGRMGPDVQKRFIELAGGLDAKFVVVPTVVEAAADSERETAWLKKAGAKHVVLLHAADRAQADSRELVEKIRTADAVWFGGGRQWRFVDSYEGTACYEAFHEVLRRGGVIGGSSAGATIQGEYLVRGSPLVNTIMMAEGYERGFGFLPGTAVDQHFSQRGRAPDMLSLKRTFPQLLGLGIDEATAVVVRGAELEVVGENQVSVYPPLPADRKLAATDTAPPVVEPEVLKPGDRYDLAKFRRRMPAKAATAE